jgi:hypothetical protein
MFSGWSPWQAIGIGHTQFTTKILPPRGKSMLARLDQLGLIKLDRGRECTRRAGSDTGDLCKPIFAKHLLAKNKTPCYGAAP